MGFPGGGEILAILVVALVVFGPNRLPEIARQIGGAMRTLREMQSTVKRELSDALDIAGKKDAVYGEAMSAPSYAEHGFDEQPPLPMNQSPVDQPPANPGPTFGHIEPPSSSFS